MLIYLDTKDLIDIVEKSNPISPDEFENILFLKNHKIVISNTILLELAEPLLHKSTKTNVMRAINRLEEFPHKFINTKNLVYQELKEAIMAFKNDREYRTINPFTNRYIEAIDFDRIFPWGKYIISSLSELVFIMFQEGVIENSIKHAENWRIVLSFERSIPKKLNARKRFINTISKHLKMVRLRPPYMGLEVFGNWIYEKSYRCPSIRLINEIFNKMLNNVDDIPDDSDLEDFSHIQCIPYVDLMTVDRRFYAYISQAARSFNIDYESKIRKSVNDLLDLI